MKRIISWCLTFSLILSMSVNSLAVTEGHDLSRNIEEDYYSYTIDFQSDVSVANVQGEYTDNDGNEDRVAQAKEYVKSLNLGDMGYQNIEDACLMELDSLGETARENNSRLVSYTVLVPKNRALTYQYYGAYNGKSFYSSFYGYHDMETEYIEYSTASKIQNWATGIINFLLALPGATPVLTIPWAVISNLMGAPSNYVTSGSAYIQHYALSRHHSRGIYWRENSSTYTLVYADEMADVTLWFVFHPVDADYDLSYSTKSNQQTVYADNYSDEEYILESADYAATREMVFTTPVYIQDTNLNWVSA